ncbi:MAG: NAD-dependent epimerase/dehydratase family protein [Lutibacter sp.]|nr:NAD-dependent epimerase/dehydratase family protein [Lutibacter sp.]
MNILITGITGFVGQNLARYLSDIDILGISREAKGINISYPELSLNIFNQQKAFIHLAGKAHDLKKISNPQEYYEANFELTKQLFNAFLNSDAKLFIFMSTVKAAADDVVGVLTEETDPNPKTHYGIAKHQAEQYILSKELPLEKRVYILRPCMIHGPGNKGNLSLLYKLVSKNIPWPLGAFDNKRSFCSIDNLLFIIKELIEREDIPSGIYNVSDDEPLSTNELINLIAGSINIKPRIIPVSKKLIFVLARLGDILRLPLNTERLVKLTENFVVSNTKIKTALQLEKLPISSKVGLIKTINSFKML